MIEQLFFELIRVALGTQETLSRPPSKVEWAELYAMSKKQSLVGICFSAVQKLTNNQEPRTQNLDEVQYLTWMGMAAKIQQRNEVVNRQCVELQAKLSERGVRNSILKGQGVALSYPVSIRGLRQSGDIDIYVSLDGDEAYELAKSLSKKEVPFEFKHFQVDFFPDTEVELHYIPEGMFNRFRLKRLLKWYASDEVKKWMFEKITIPMVTPSADFNAVFILLHTYRHLMSGGVGLRQLMDYYFVMHEFSKVADEASRAKVKKMVSVLGMERFASATMWIMVNVFGMDNEHLLWESNASEGRFLLNEVMASGNFGHYDERFGKSGGTRIGFMLLLLRRNMHLLTHYPSEALWTPFYYCWHFAWKRMHRNNKE